MLPQTGRCEVVRRDKRSSSLATALCFYLVLSGTAAALTA